MEFYICSTYYNDEDEIDNLIRDYPQIEKYNPLIKEYQWDWEKDILILVKAYLSK